ncbi:MAG TPA: TIGR02266 family protein [Thermodesulfobacteriota bacterium]|nr:TIGR02266 family protein [Thermodesulfobacteriota bacterium]
MMTNSDYLRKGTLACPYCTKEIPAKVSACPWCGVSYGSETIQLVRSFVVDEVLRSDEKENDSNPKRFKIVYQTQEAFANSYLANIGKGGIFIRTERPLEKGSQFSLKIFLPDGGKELEVSCEVVWSNAPEAAALQDNASSGMGVRFLNPDHATLSRINQLLGVSDSAEC